jgi:uncharacterized protein (DUF433 family)
MLGEGVYIVSEIARLTEMNPARVRSWFKPRSDGLGRGPVFESDYAIADGDFAVSFLDLIDVLVVGQFRDRYRIPMSTIRKAYTLLQQELSVKHPFCHGELYTDGKRIFHCIANKAGDPKLSEVISHQQFFLYIKQALDHIEYSPITQLAKRWRIAKGVVIDPTISMGKPTIADTGLTTFVAANQYHANSGDSALVADLFCISEQDVMNAVQFEKWYRDRQAA